MKPSQLSQSLALVGVILIAAMAVTEATKPSDDYLAVPGTGSVPIAERESYLGERRAVFSYVDLKAAGFTTYPDGVYAQNVTMPGGPSGNFYRESQRTMLLDEVVTRSVSDGQAEAAGKALNTSLNTLSDYENIYSAWGFTPLGLQGWRTDEHFGKLRKTWLPLFLERTSALPSFVPNDALSNAAADIAAKRLYHVDYAKLVPMLGVTSPTTGTLCDPTYALFRQAQPTSQSSPLLPVGIFLRGQWLSPQDGDAWMLAKLACNCAEGSALQTFDHFLETHLLLAPVVIATQRRLYPSHPVRALLSQPFEYNIALAAVGFPGLFSAGTPYDLHIAYGGVGAHAYINAGWAAMPFTDRYLDAEMQRRGLSNLGGYSFRSDMEEYRTMYQARVASFVAKYYKNDAAVAGDAELQAWRAEIADPALGRVYGFPALTTRSALIDLAVHVLLSVLRHHATNTRGYGDFMLVLPYAPWRLNCDMPADKTQVTDAWITSECMPNLDQAQKQIAHTSSFKRPFPASYSLLNSPSTAETGLRDLQSRAALRRDLEQFSREIKRRPSGGVLPYTLLDPEFVPRSGYV